MNLVKFNASAKETLREFDEIVSSYLFLKNALPDHICYKCSTHQEFLEIKEFLEKEGLFNYQTEISGRQIATIKLKTPFTCSLGKIYVLELSDQKPDNSQVSGWDHLEVRHTDNDYDYLVQSATDQNLIIEKKERPHHATHEVVLCNNFKLVFTREFLVEKIRREIS